MNSTLRRMIMESKRGGRDGRRGRRDYGRGEYSGEFRGDYESDYGYDDRRGRRRDYGHDDYDDEYERDGRRGVKGTGPYGIGGRLHYPRRDYGRDDYDDYDDEDGRRGYRRDYGDDEDMRLSTRDMDEWKRNLENADGTRGEHFSSSQIKQAMQSLGIRASETDEKDICMTANMIYSDYGKTLSQWIPKDKEAMIYVKLAKDFLDDKDAAVHDGEKLAAYYYLIVKGGEE